MTLLNTLTRKTARVRMERKLTVSKTKVFVPKLVGTKICRPVSSSLTLVPAVVSCCDVAAVGQEHLHQAAAGVSQWVTRLISGQKTLTVFLDIVYYYY